MEDTDKKENDIKIIKEKIKNKFHRDIKQIHPDSGKGTDYEASILIEKYRKQIELVENYEKKVSDNHIDSNMRKMEQLIAEVFTNEKNIDIREKIAFLTEIDEFSKVNLNLIFDPGDNLRYPNILTAYKCLHDIFLNYEDYKRKDAALFRDLFFTRVEDIQTLCKTYSKKSITNQLIAFCSALRKYLDM